MKRQVWIISEGSPGHVSQSAGLVRALAQRIEIDTTVVETRPKPNGFVRALLRLWMGPSGRPLPDGFLRGVLGCAPPENQRPDLIVASGGKAVFAAHALAAKTRAPLVFIGERKPYPSAWFHTVLTPSPSERGANDVPLERIPTKMTRADLSRAAAEWREKPDGRLWAMIIGGKSASHLYQDSDWQALAQGMNRLAAGAGIRWLVSTSRRTGAAAERILRDTLDPAQLAHTIWWSENPEKRLPALLGAAEAVFVTQDSVTMVTEALASGKPVVVVTPADVRFTAGSFLPDYFERLSRQRLFLRCEASRIGNLSAADFTTPADASAYEDQLAAALLKRLGFEDANA